MIKNEKDDKFHGKINKIIKKTIQNDKVLILSDKNNKNNKFLEL
jgi:hypothetical protein